MQKPVHCRAKLQRRPVQGFRLTCTSVWGVTSHVLDQYNIHLVQPSHNLTVRIVLLWHRLPTAHHNMYNLPMYIHRYACTLSTSNRVILPTNPRLQALSYRKISKIRDNKKVNGLLGSILLWLVHITEHTGQC